MWNEQNTKVTESTQAAIERNVSRLDLVRQTDWSHHHIPDNHNLHDECVFAGEKDNPGDKNAYKQDKYRVKENLAAFLDA